MAKGKRPPPPSTDTHRSKVAPTRPTGQPTRLTLYCPAKQGQHRQTEKCQHMPARQLCKQPFRDKLHLGQLARYGTVCCRTYSVPHFALWPIFIMGSADPRLGAFYEALGPFSGVFPPFYVPNVRRLPAACAGVCAGAYAAGTPRQLSLCTLDRDSLPHGKWYAHIVPRYSMQTKRRQERRWSTSSRRLDRAGQPLYTVPWIWWGGFPVWEREVSDDRLEDCAKHRSQTADDSRR